MDKTSAPLFTSYQKFIVLILTLLQFTIVLDFMILSPLGDILMKSLSIDPIKYGSVVSSYAFSACISAILAAGFADKFDRKKLLLFFYTGFIVGTLFCGIANTYETLLAARIVTGIFGGVVGSVTLAIVTDLFQISQRGKVMGFIQMAFAGSQVLGIPVGLKLANWFDWHATFLMLVGLACIVALLIVWRMKPVTEHLKLQHDKSPLQHLWHTLKKRNYTIGFLATAFLSMGGFMIMPFSTPFLVNNVLIKQEELAMIFLCTGLSSMVVMPLVGKVADKVDKFWLFTVGSVLASIMVIVYTNLGPSSVWTVVAVNIVLFMGIMSRMVPATALNASIPEMADRGAYMSVNSALQMAAGGLGSVFASMIVVQKSKTSPIENFNVLGYIMIGMFVICLYFVFRMNAIVKKKQQQQPAQKRPEPVETLH